MRILVSEIATRGGNWFSAVGYARLLQRAGASVELAGFLHTSQDVNLGGLTLRPLAFEFSEGEGFGKYCRSYLQYERALAALAGDYDVVITQAQQFGTAVRRNILTVCHNPDPRPVFGSTALASAVDIWRFRTPLNVIRHAGGFSRLGRRWEWPHPAISAQAELPSGSAATDRSSYLLFFGRSLQPEGIREALSWHEASGTSARAIPWLLAGQMHPGVTQMLDTRGVKYRALGYRPESAEIDDLVRRSLAVAIPHKGFPRSCSGILAIATAWQRQAIVSDDINPELIWPRPQVIRGRIGLDVLLNGDNGRPDRIPASESDWGQNVLSLLSAI